MTCATGQRPCGGRCVNPLTDPTNCGGCGVVCPGRPGASATCAAGRCGITCTAGFADCDHNPSNGCERDLRGDVVNCGACGVRCSAMPGGTVACVGGTCRSTCASPNQDCGGRCVNLATDANNCGACGRACGSLQYCEAGACRMVCVAPTTLCGARCVNLQTDPSNCGACGRTCGSSERCNGGVCQRRCTAGLTPCGGACVDLRTSRTNCGACGRTCAPAERCESGGCVLNCSAGEVICSGLCADLNSNSNNCGTCGHACRSGERCESGRCQPTVCGSSIPTLVRPIDGARVPRRGPVEFEWIAPAACAPFVLRARYCCHSGTCRYSGSDPDRTCPEAFAATTVWSNYISVTPTLVMSGFVRWSVTTSAGQASDIGITEFR